MNKTIILILFFIFLGCEEDTVRNNNSNIPNYTFTLEINLNLPSNSSLQFASNHVLYTNVGARGIVVFNTGSGYVAYDLACPNQSFESCTAAMTINGIEAECECDETSYNLFSGQGEQELEYGMKQYNVEVNGNIITVYN